MFHNRQPYIPDHEKWVWYYESFLIREHPLYHPPRSGVVDKKAPTEHKTPELKMKVVSPAQQVVEQAISQIKRENDDKKIKRSCDSIQGKRRSKTTLKLTYKGDDF